MIETSINSQYSTTANQLAKLRYNSAFRNVMAMVFFGFIAIYFLFAAEPDWTKLAWAAFIIALAAVFYQPRYGLYAILFFSLVGDIRVSHFLPFDKNLSSEESIFYLHDSAAFSPVEILFILTIALSLIHI